MSKPLKPDTATVKLNRRNQVDYKFKTTEAIIQYFVKIPESLKPSKVKKS